MIPAIDVVIWFLLSSTTICGVMVTFVVADTAPDESRVGTGVKSTGTVPTKTSGTKLVMRALMH